MPNKTGSATVEIYTSSALELPSKMALRDVREAASTLGAEEVKYLVSYYYLAQEHRMAADNQVLALAKNGEPNTAIEWLAQTEGVVERQIRSVLDKWSMTEPTGVGQWSRGIVGIGPVLSAGLLAHIDITASSNVAKLLSFAGQNPKAVWLSREKVQQLVNNTITTGTEEELIAISNAAGRNIVMVQKAAFDENGKLDKKALAKYLGRRPWNARLKVLCWKCGESFVKTCNHPNSQYGPLYLERKQKETAMNDRGEFAETAAEIIRTKNYGHDTDAFAWYTKGKLPPAHLHARAKRHAVKIFLSHLWTKMYEAHYHKPAPMPWVIAHGGHTDYIPPPA